MEEEPPCYFHSGSNTPHSPQPHPYLNPFGAYSGQQASPARRSKRATLEKNHNRVLSAPPYLTGQPLMMPMETTSMCAGQQPVHPTVMMPTGPMFLPQYLTPCQQGQHNLKTRYRPCGIMAAVLFFPVGLIMLCLDTEECCTRCGAKF